jgi:hypothetical protein
MPITFQGIGKTARLKTLFRLVAENGFDVIRWIREGAFHEVIEPQKVRVSADGRVGVGVSPEEIEGLSPGIVAQWQFEFIRLQKTWDWTARSWSICAHVSEFKERAVPLRVSKTMRSHVSRTI